MKLIGKITINVLTLFVVQYLVPGFFLADFAAALVAAIVIGMINAFIKPILQIVALPISILTFGLAAFFINVMLLMLASYIVPGFEIQTFFTGVIASLVFSLVSWFLHQALHD